MKTRGSMRIIIFYLAVLGLSSAVPNGYYHQEYNYKTSSSSFKNNELQHKTDDQGYYRKDGDLDGRVKPVVDANSEHSEYVNPNSQSGQYSGANTDFSSAGNIRAQSGYSGYGSNGLDAEGFAHSDRIIGGRGYSSGFSSGYGSNSIGSNSQSYSTSSNLRLITTRLQQELESELQEAIRQNNIYPQSRVDISQLERELRQNLTERLNNELTARYGQQMVRGGMSYTITGGRLQSTANYDNEELSNLRRQLEDSLMNKLRTQYSSSSSSSHYYNNQGRYGYTTTVRPVYHQVYPSLPSYTTTVRYPVDYSHNNYQTIRYTPVTTPETITNIASRIQGQLDTRLNDVLEETRKKYFSSSTAYSLTNTDVLLERIRNELRSNLTYLLDEDIRRNYGTQIQRDGYLYSVGPSGQTSTNYNYSLRDLENLKQQVERNLIEKLNRDFETYRASWSSHQSYNSQSSYGSNYQYSSTPRYAYGGSQRYEYTTPRYEIFTTPRQSYVNPYPTSAAHQSGYIQTGGSASNQYDYTSGSQHSGYGVQSSGSIAQLQRQLQDDLSRQLRGALRTGHYSSYSSDGVSNGQNYQTTLQQLSDELNRNLTKHLQEYSAMGSYAAYGNFDNAQMQRLKSQLQDSLMNQLQQSLQQSYQSSSSYSSSSSSSSNSNYRPVRGFQNYQGGQYRSGIETVAGEDCLGDDPNTHNHISKRSLRVVNGFRKQGQFLSFGSNITPGGPSHHVQHPIEVGQEVDDYDTTQQLEDSGLERFSNYGQGQDEIEQHTVSRNNAISHHGQQIDDSDSIQQMEDTGYGKLQVFNHGQQIDDSDSIQQIEDTGYGKLQVLNHGQQIDDSDLTQQVEDSGYRKLQVPTHGQQIDDSDSIQQIEDTGYGKLQVPNHGQQIDDLDLTQQIEDTGYGKLHVSNHGQQIDDSTQQIEDTGYGKLQVSNNGQQIDDSTQQIEDTGYGRLQVSNHGQQIDDSDLTQQVEDSGYKKLQVPTHGQHIDESDSIQQIEDTGYGKLQVSNHGQQIDDSGLTQQIEDTGYGKLKVSNHGQQIDDSTQQIEDTGYGKLQVSNHGQQIDDSDLTQQVEDSDYRKLQVPTHGQQIDEPDSIQQIDDTGNGKLQVSNHGQQIDDSDLTQQIEDTGYGKLQVSNHGQQIDDSDLIQQIEDTGYGKLQLSNHGQRIDDSDLTQQVEDGGYRRLQISNHGQQMDDSDLTQQVDQSRNEKLRNPSSFSPDQKINNYDLNQEQIEQSGYRRHDIPQDQKNEIEQEVDNSNQELQHTGVGNQHPQHPVQTGQEMDSEPFGNVHVGEQTQLIDTEPVDESQQHDQTHELGRHQPVSNQQIDESGYGYHPYLEIPSGQQIDNSDDTYQKYDSGELIHQTDNNQQEIEHPGVSQYRPQYHPELKPGTQDDMNGKLPVGKQPQVITQGQIPESEEKVEETRPIEPEAGTLNQQKPQGGQGQQFEVPQMQTTEREQAIHQNNNRTPDHQMPEIPDYGTEDIEGEWCSKYIDVSIMDAPWQLSSQLIDEIRNQYNKMQNALEKPQDKLYQKILSELPKRIMYTCFHVNDMKLSQREEDQVIKGLEDYFRSLIKQEIIDITTQKSKKVETSEEENYSQFESFYKPKDWCSDYIDKTLMDAPWVLGIQLKNIVAKYCSSTPEMRIRRILDEIPKNLTECFNLQSMGLTEGQLDEKRDEIDNHLKSLIKQEIGSICRIDDQEIENDNSQKIIGNPSNNQQTQSQPSSPNYDIFGPTTEADKLPTLNQVIENGQKRDDILTQQQVTNDVTDEFNVAPQEITPSSSHNLEPPKNTGGEAFEFTDQGQIYHRPQTLPEAENTADSLIDALRNSQANRQNPQVIEDYAANGYHRRYDYNSFRSQNRIYETSRPFGQPQGPGYHHPKYIPSSAVGHGDSGYTHYGSYGSQNWRKPSHKPFNYGNEPSSYHRQNTGYDHISSSDTDSFRQYQTRNYNGYSRQQMQYNKPLNYAHTEVVEQNFETASELEPKRSGQTIVVNPVRPVYSGVKGRRRYNSLSNQPTSPQVEPVPVEVEPIAIQRIVSQDTAVTPKLTQEQSTSLGTTPEDLPWWKRFGNKVKQGAADLKKKIIG